MLHFVVIGILILLFILSISYRESFNTCTGTDCKSCSSQSGCAWCDETKKCVESTTLKSTGSACNQRNAITSSFLCPDVVAASYTGKVNDPKEEQIYRDQIADRVRPPNVGMNDEMQYSPETIMGNLNELRHTLADYQQQLPDMISSSVENSIQPMVKGLLSSPYM